MIKGPSVRRPSFLPSLSKTAPGARFSGPLKLDPTEVFIGKVVRSYADGRVLISAKGKHFLATSQVFLSQGKRYRFQVKDLGPTIRLRVLGGKALHKDSPLHQWASTRAERDGFVRALRWLVGTRGHAGMKGSLGIALRDLGRLFPILIYRGSGSEDGTWLCKSLMASGIFWENKLFRDLTVKKRPRETALQLKDLKGILLRVLRSLEEEPDTSSGTRLEVLKKAQQALSFIESHQLLNVSALQEGWGWYWWIPSRETAGFQGAEVFGREDREAGFYTASIAVDLTELGRFLARLSLAEPKVSIRIEVEDSAKKRIVDRHLALLTARLHGAGLEVERICCEVAQGMATGAPFREDAQQLPSIHLVI